MDQEPPQDRSLFVTPQLSGSLLLLPSAGRCLVQEPLRMWTSDLEVPENRAKPLMMGFLEGSYLLSALSCFVFVTRRESAVGADSVVFM